jgi:oligopeptidase A
MKYSSNPDYYMNLLHNVRREIAVVIPPKSNRFPNNFSHIFAGGYAAGYFSYKWAEVLSADVYSEFEKHNVLSPKIGAKFKNEVLSRGGSRPMMKSFIAFLGRKPKIDSLLKHSGLS